MEDEAFALVVATPMPCNLYQHCLFVGGPNKKWLDFIHVGPVFIQSDLSGLRYWEADKVGIIQKVSTETEITLGPGSCEPAGMLYFTKLDVDTRVDSSAEKLSNDVASTTAPSSENLDEYGALYDERFENELAARKLEDSDLYLLFFKAQWEIPKIRRKAAERADFVQSLSSQEREKAVNDLVQTIMKEYDLLTLEHCSTLR